MSRARTYQSRCKRHGLTPYYVSSATCVACARDYSRRHAERHPEALRAARARWRESNRRKASEASRRWQTTPRGRSCSDCPRTDEDAEFPTSSLQRRRKGKVHMLKPVPLPWPGKPYEIRLACGVRLVARKKPSTTTWLWERVTCKRCLRTRQREEAR